MTATQAAPTWDLSTYFPQFDGPEYREHVRAVTEEIAALERQISAIGPITAETAPRWAKTLVTHEAVIRRYQHVSSYLGCLSAADASNESVARERAKLARLGASLKKASIPFDDAMRAVDDAGFEALAAQPEVEDLRFFLEEARREARYLMDASRERLAADLNVDSLSAWSRLYDTIAGKLEFTYTKPGGTTETVPMAQKGTLIDSPDPAVRKAVLEGSNRAWESVQDSVAACLNGIAGTRLTLNEYRGIDHFLDVAAMQSRVSRETIDAMWTAVASKRAFAWKVLGRKARALGKQKLGFQDLTAPLPLENEAKFSWRDGSKLMLEAFDATYPNLADFSRAMIEKRFVEAQMRKGKRPGAFCTTSYQTLESRVFMSFGGTVGSIQTLAHELGHAWHNRIMRDVRPFARMYPMTLAETASTTAEDLLTRSLAGREDLPLETRAAILDTALTHATVFLLNIHMRYLFEERFYTERTEGEVSVSRLKELMLQAQRECYGPVLADEEYDPMFWASKLHFYIAGVTFYNFPYTFGFLLSQGISAMLRRDGLEFLPRYERFLHLTGSGMAEDVAARGLGVDLRSTAFWAMAIDGLEEDYGRWESLLSELGM